jgi:hypothetical protein
MPKSMSELNESEFARKEINVSNLAEGVATLAWRSLFKPEIFHALPRSLIEVTGRKTDSPHSWVWQIAADVRAELCRLGFTLHNSENVLPRAFEWPKGNYLFFLCSCHRTYMVDINTGLANRHERKWVYTISIRAHEPNLPSHELFVKRYPERSTVILASLDAGVIFRSTSIISVTTSG